MKKLFFCATAAALLLCSAKLAAQTTQTQPATKEIAPAKTIDQGSEGAITMEEYETLLKIYQKANPGKTFQSMSKEQFETYLTTELAALRKKRAEEALPKESPQKAAEPK
ncbi:MAG: hypothetical protein SH857_14720 [Chitinophagales bacterium]|nr:hypothetical protein [Chitinophagales bacterium]